MKHPKISRRVETRPYGRVSTPTGNCRKFLTQLSAQGSHRGADADMGHGHLPLTRATAAEAHACARSRWKIENETFNTLKNQGYELEHNFGHGHQHLATVLMLLAFLIDQLQELCCLLFQSALAKAGPRYALWERLRLHLTLMPFPG